MKIRMTLLMFCVLAITPAIFAQSTVKLFESAAIAASPGGTFGTAQVYLSCPANATATLSGPSRGGLIVDNFLSVNGVNVCPNGGNCFSNVISDPGQNLGQSAESSFLPVAPINISNRLKVGTHLYTFNMVDISYTFASSEINLTTSCELFTQTVEDSALCHKDNGSKQEKTIYVGGVNAINAHLSQHEGDYTGPCKVGENIK